jgi:hypothetical protein
LRLFVTEICNWDFWLRFEILVEFEVWNLRLKFWDWYLKWRIKIWDLRYRFEIYYWDLKLGNIEIWDLKLGFESEICNWNFWLDLRLKFLTKIFNYCDWDLGIHVQILVWDCMRFRFEIFYWDSQSRRVIKIWEWDEIEIWDRDCMSSDSKLRSENEIQKGDSRLKFEIYISDWDFWLWLRFATEISNWYLRLRFKVRDSRLDIEI